MPKPWELLNTKYIINNPWIKFSEREFRLPNGDIIPDYYIVEKPDVAIVVPHTNDKKTLIMKEFERGVMEEGYKFPAGRVNKNEAAEDAARREFLEETGFSIGALRLLGVLDVDPGWLTTKVHVFLAEELEKVAEPEVNPKEEFDAEWIDFQALGEMITKGEVHNIFVVSAYYMAKQQLDSQKS